MLTSCSQIWPLKSSDAESLYAFKRQLLLRIIGPVSERGVRKKRYNEELYCKYENPPIRRIIRSGKLKWAGRMNDWDILKTILNGNSGGRRGRSRPKFQVTEDVGKIELAQNLGNWRKIVEEAKIQNELYSYKHRRKTTNVSNFKVRL